MTELPIPSASDELRVFPEKSLDEYLIEAWSRKWWIIGATFIAAALGVTTALLSRPVYQSKAVIAAKENQSPGGASAMLSSLGGLGGFAAQLGIGAGQNDHLVLMLQSWEFMERVVQEHRLAPKFFPNHWNAEEKRWKNPDSTKWPKPFWSVSKLKGSLDIENDKRTNSISIKAQAGSPELAQELVSDCLLTFNDFLRERTLVKLRANMEYLQNQHGQTMDPMLREKIQVIIAGEIEKSMLMSVSGFDILQHAVLPLEYIKPNRRIIVIAFTLAGFAIALFGTFAMNYLLALRRRLLG
ncbi:MAG: Wzz/FepE/Etk N-terminal domain-containing protein [Fibrobacteria bacterium]